MCGCSPIRRQHLPRPSSRFVRPIVDVLNFAVGLILVAPPNMKVSPSVVTKLEMLVFACEAPNARVRRRERPVRRETVSGLVSCTCSAATLVYFRVARRGVLPEKRVARPTD